MDTRHAELKPLSRNPHRLQGGGVRGNVTRKRSVQTFCPRGFDTVGRIWHCLNLNDVVVFLLALARSFSTEFHLPGLHRLNRRQSVLWTVGRAWRGHGAGVARATGHLCLGWRVLQAIFALGGAGVARASPVTPGVP
eukprot:gene8493-biopygen21157